MNHYQWMVKVTAHWHARERETAVCGLRSGFTYSWFGVYHQNDACKRSRWCLVTFQLTVKDVICVWRLCVVSLSYDSEKHECDCWCKMRQVGLVLYSQTAMHSHYLPLQLNFQFWWSPLCDAEKIDYLPLEVAHLVFGTRMVIVAWRTSTWAHLSQLI